MSRTASSIACALAPSNSRKAIGCGASRDVGVCFARDHEPDVARGPRRFVARIGRDLFEASAAHHLFPGAERDQWRSGPEVLVGEVPPALGQAPHHFVPPPQARGFHQHQQPAGDEQTADLRDAVANSLRRVHHVVAENDVEAVQRISLGFRVAGDVEHAEAHEIDAVGGSVRLGAADEGVAEVGEMIFDRPTLQGLDGDPGQPSGAAADLENSELVFARARGDLGEKPGGGSEVDGIAGVGRRGAGALVEKIRRSVGVEHGDRGDLSRQRRAVLTGTMVEQSHNSLKIRILGEDLLTHTIRLIQAQSVEDLDLVPAQSNHAVRGQ